MAIMSAHAQSINGAIFCRSTEIRSRFAKMSQKSDSRRIPWSTSSGCFAGIKIMAREQARHSSKLRDRSEAP